MWYFIFFKLTLYTLIVFPVFRLYQCIVTEWLNNVVKSEFGVIMVFIVTEWLNNVVKSEFGVTMVFIVTEWLTYVVKSE